jgi:hypothetical protein
LTSEGTNRQPQGGQFVPNQHPGATIRLFDRTDGSFLNPAPSATAEHCIDFWSRIEIPDEIIDQVVNAYAKFRSEEIDTEMEQIMTEWSARWQEQNPAPTSRHMEEYQQRYRAEHEKHRQSVLSGVVGKRPEALGQYDTRQLIRATKMLIHRPNPNRFPGEDRKVLEQPVELFDETLTVWEIHEKYSLYDIRHSMEKVFRNDADAMLKALESQSEQLSGIHEQLVYARADMGDQ